ncbi:hypothetical protein [Actinoplanes sp. L3-i22]|uniref:hypothetical protein n=1 Tax=Actinoplanes sp. L3-i22 TaxID=2836373 RepID=UPI001C77974A|nr:hypothetical protein [Actinoplanes sp. L3-i22]BCY05675.1 hypothetical protein L3i22_007630 [Actinoplanes sp. L3-i22]
MSFEQLMQHAHDIRATATAKALEQHGVREAPKPGDPPFAPRPGEDASRASIVAGFADIVSLFEPFAMMPDPATFDGPILDLLNGLQYLAVGVKPIDPITGHPLITNLVMDRVGASESYLEEWTGDAADAFRSDLVHPFLLIVMNQLIGCSVLRSALMAQRALWVSAREDIDKVAHATLTALDNMGHCGQNTWTMSWTIVSSIAAVAAVPISAGTSLLGEAAALGTATAVTAVGAAGQVAAAYQVEPEKETTYHGETAEAVIEQMRHGVNQAISEIQQGEQLIAAALRSVSGTVRQSRRAFVGPQPKLLDATSRTVFDEWYLGRAR